MKYKLMLKTHYETGVNYLCVTTRNPHTYNGSGKRWRKLLNKLRSEIYTFILYESNDLETFNLACRLYSEKLNVDKSWAFANLIPEVGYDIHFNAHLGAQRLKETGNRSGIYSPEWRNNNKDKVLINSKKGGRIGGKITGNMYWWNNGKINTKSFICPGDGWFRGMLMSDKKKKQVYTKIAGHNRKNNVIKK